jgi:hypothetical protein
MNYIYTKKIKVKFNLTDNNSNKSQSHFLDGMK